MGRLEPGPGLEPGPELEPGSVCIVGRLEPQCIMEML